MSSIPQPLTSDPLIRAPTERPQPSQSPWALAGQSGRVIVGGGIVLAILAVCVLTLPWTLRRASGMYYDRQTDALVRQPPKISPSASWFGYDGLGRSLLAR